jgi:carbamoyl-phosphate synthase large subunit
VIVRPSFVLGGRAMKIVYDPKELENFTRLAILASPGIPCSSTSFWKMRWKWMWMPSATGQTTIIGGIMEHIEAAGVHSATPPVSATHISIGSGV